MPPDPCRLLRGTPPQAVEAASSRADAKREDVWMEALLCVFMCGILSVFDLNQ